MEDVRGPARGVGGSEGQIGVLLPSGWVYGADVESGVLFPTRPNRQRGAAGSAREEEEDPARSN